MRLSGCLSLLVFGLFCSPGFAGDKAIIVLDASGSMWGQLQGRAKIEIARETLGEVLGSIPDDLSLGLVVYGHRRKGDCTDIELLVPPTVGSGPAVFSAASGLKPKGKTPLSAAVVQAAETLKYTEDKATVILITDGLETCDQDPCAVGRSLAEAGVGFTVHVVGFGLSDEEGKQVACLAENTGGMYLPASDAQQLGEALSETVAIAIEQEGPAAEPALQPVPTPEPEVPPVPEASLSADERIEQASKFAITWDGPGERYDAIQIFDPQALNGEGKVVRSTTLVHGDMENRQVTMVAPAKPGGYLLRYRDRHSRRTIATRPIEVVETSVSLSAPETVEIGRPIAIDWRGPGGLHDSVVLYDPSAMHGEGKRVHAQDVRGSSASAADFENRHVTMPGPGKVGTYELRYWNAANRAVMATRKIQVVEGELSLNAPERIEAATNLTVEWTGPGARYDAVQLFDPSAMNGEGKRVREKRLRNDDFENRKVSMPAPAKAGTYELRYWNGDNKTVLVSRPIVVTEAQVSLSAPDRVMAGESFTVDWTGPGARYDEVQVIDGNGKPISGKRLRNDAFDRHKVTIKAPKEPGQVQLRYWNGENKAVLATVPLAVE